MNREKLDRLNEMLREQESDQCKWYHPKIVFITSF